MRYVQRLTGQPLSDLATVPSDDVQALFSTGETSRRMLTDLIRDLDPSVWDVPREFVILGHNVTATPKKIVMHVLMHEIRHWAQLATLCRLNGLVVEWQDFLGSPVWGGAFQSVSYAGTDARYHATVLSSPSSNGTIGVVAEQALAPC